MNISTITHFAKAHPVETGVGIVTIVVVFYWLFLSGSGSSNSAGASGAGNASAFFAAQAQQAQFGDALALGQDQDATALAQTIATGNTTATVNGDWASAQTAQVESTNAANVDINSSNNSTILGVTQSNNSTAVAETESNNDLGATEYNDALTIAEAQVPLQSQEIAAQEDVDLNVANQQYVLAAGGVGSSSNLVSESGNATTHYTGPPPANSNTSSGISGFVGGLLSAFL